MLAYDPLLKPGTRYVNGQLPAMPVIRGPHQALFTLPHGTKIYGPVSVRDEYIEFIWDGAKYECHLDEFVSETRGDPAELHGFGGADEPAASDVSERPNNGLPIAFENAGGLSRSRMAIATSPPSRSAHKTFCTEQRRLLDMFGEAVQELLLLHEQQFLAIVAGDLESHRFDLLIHMASEKKMQAKYAYLHHVESHGCSANNVIDQG